MSSPWKSELLPSMMSPMIVSRDVAMIRTKSPDPSSVIADPMIAIRHAASTVPGRLSGSLAVNGKAPEGYWLNAGCP